MAGRPPILFPADAPSIDRHSGRWCAQNVAKRPREGATGGARPGKHNGRSAPGRWAGKSPPAPVRCHWTIGRRRGRMGTQNGGQWLGLRHRGAPVETQTWSVTEGRDRQPAPRRRVRETPRPQSDVAGRSAEISVLFLFPIEAD